MSTRRKTPRPKDGKPLIVTLSPETLAALAKMLGIDTRRPVRRLVR